MSDERGEGGEGRAFTQENRELRTSESETRGVRAAAEVTNSGVVAPFELRDFPGAVEAGRIESSTLLSSVIGGDAATLRNTATGTIIGNLSVRATAQDSASSTTIRSDSDSTFDVPANSFSQGSQVDRVETVLHSESSVVGGTARVNNAGAIGLELEAPGGGRPASNLGGVVDVAGGNVAVDNSGVVAGVLTARGVASDASTDRTTVIDSRQPFGDGITGATVTSTQVTETVRSGDGDNGAISVNNTGTLLRGVRIDGRGTGELTFDNSGALGDESRGIVAFVELSNLGGRDVATTEREIMTTRDPVETVTTLEETVNSSREVLMKDVAFQNGREVNASFSLNGGNAAFSNAASGQVGGSVTVDALVDRGATSATVTTRRTTAVTLGTGVSQVRSEDVTEHREEHAVGGDASVTNAGSIAGGVTAVGLTSAAVDNGDGASIDGSVVAVSRSRDRVRDANTADGFSTSQTTVGGVASVVNAGSIGANTGGSITAFGAAQSHVNNDGVVGGGITAGSRAEHDWVNTVNDEAVAGPEVTYAAAASIPEGVSLFDPFSHAAVAALGEDGDVVRRAGDALLGSAYVWNEFQVGGDVQVGSLDLSVLVNDGVIDDDVAMAAFAPRPESEGEDGDGAGFVDGEGGMNLFVNTGIVRGDVLFGGAQRTENAASSSFPGAGARAQVGGDSLLVMAAGSSVLGAGGNTGASSAGGDCGEDTAICFDVDGSRNTLRVGAGAQVGSSGLEGSGGIRLGGFDSSNLVQVGTGARILGDISGATDALGEDRSDTRLEFDVDANGATEYSHATHNVASLDKTGAGSLVLNRFVERQSAASDLQAFSHDIDRVGVAAGTLVVGKFVVTGGRVVPLSEFLGNTTALPALPYFGDPNAVVSTLADLDRDYHVSLDGDLDVASAGTLMGELSMTGDLTNAGRLVPGTLVQRADGPLSNLTSANDQLVVHGVLHAEGDFEQSASGQSVVYARPPLGRTVSLPDTQVPELGSPPVFQLRVSPWAPVTDASLATSRIVVDGDGTMAGRLEVLTAENALYRAGDRYDFLDVAGSANTAGLSVTAPGSSALVSFTPTTRVEGGRTIVAATVNRASYGTVLPAGEGNRQTLAEMLDDSVAEVVDRLTANQFDSVAEFNEVQNMATTLAGLDRMAGVNGGVSAFAAGAPQASITQAFDELNGGVLPTLVSVDPGRNFLGAIDRRISGLEFGSRGDRISRGESPASLWAQPLGWNEELDSDGDYVGVDVDGRGYSVGGDLLLEDAGVLVGFAAAKTSADVASSSGPAANADYDSLALGTYLSTSIGNVRIDGSIASISSDVESRRQLPMFGSAADAEFDVDEFRVALGASYDFDLENGATITPSINFIYRSRDVGSFSEDGVGGVGLVVDGVDDSFLTTSLGVSAQRSWRFGELAVTPVVGMQVRFEGEDAPELEARMRGSDQRFTIEGVQRDTVFMPHAGVVLRYGKGVEVYINGSGAYGSDQSGWNVLGGIRIGL